MAKHRPPRRPGPPRKAPPRESTGKEALYLEQRCNEGLPSIVHLVGGEQHRGIVEPFDRETVCLHAPHGPSLLLRRSEIRYMVEDRPDDA